MASEKMSNRSKIGSLEASRRLLEVRPLKKYDPKMIKNDQNQSKTKGKKSSFFLTEVRICPDIVTRFKNLLTSATSVCLGPALGTRPAWSQRVVRAVRELRLQATSLRDALPSSRLSTHALRDLGLSRPACDRRPRPQHLSARFQTHPPTLSAGAPRAAPGLHLGSPGAARGRLRYARLSLSPNLSWWCEAVLAGDPRPHSRAGSCMDTRRKARVQRASSGARPARGHSAFLAL